MQENSAALALSPDAMVQVGLKRVNAQLKRALEA